jgi:hypothetical protein
LGNLVKDRDLLDEAVTAYRAANYNVSETARQLGLTRAGTRDRLKGALVAGMISDEELRDPNAPSCDEYLAARERKFAAYQKKKRKGDWRKPVMAKLPARPFRLKVFGDPHIDADGCNFALLEKHWLEMDAAEGVYGVCVGDWFDNWRTSLAHLWKDTTVAPSDSWLCLEWLMEQRGEALIAACSGNHDDWSHGPVDPVDLLMKRHGVIYRKGAVRVALSFDDLPPIFMAVRHKWKGHSIYSAAHSIVRSAVWGWRDHLMIGGHIHQDEPRLISFPDGFRAHACQVSAFKEFDDFPDIHGMMGPKISPVWDLVIDPRRPDTDPDKVKVFWDSEDAAAFLAHLRARAF